MIRTFLVKQVNIADTEANQYARNLVAQKITTIDELLSLPERDFKEPVIGMLLGDLNRLRPKLKAPPPTAPPPTVGMKRKQRPLSFFVNGKIYEEEGCFFVNPEKSNQNLVQSVEKGHYILLLGVRGIGKSTRCNYAINHQLKEFCPLYISLQGMTISDTGTFWTDFSTRMIAYNPGLLSAEVKPVNDSRNFFEIFKNIKNFMDKKPVLFVDEFDLLLYGDKTTRVSLLDCLREMKNNRVVYCLHSFIGVGPLNITDVTATPSVSPFNINETIQSPTFTFEETKNLFGEYCREYSVKIDDTVIVDIFDRTGGHPGQVCLCGKEIEEIMRHQNYLRIDIWLPFAVYKLPLTAAARWKTSYRLQDELKANPKIQQFLLYGFLAIGDRRLKLTKTEDIAIASSLAAVGVLAGDPTVNEYWIPSKLIRACIWSSLSFTDLIDVPPPIESGRLNIEKLITTALPLFSATTMTHALSNASKQNRDTGTDVPLKSPVPNEHVYHTEITIILRKWLSSVHSWSVDTEANSGKDSCDIVVTKDEATEKYCYALELVAHATPYKSKDSLEGHFLRAADYKQNLKADEMWVINFTTRHPSKGYMWPLDSSIYAIHVYHKLDWSIAIVTTKTGSQSIKLSR